jgi:hypothetical protein
VVFLFRDKSIGSVFFLVVLCLIVHAHVFLSTPQVVVLDDDGLLSYLLQEYIKPLPPTALAFIYILLVLLQAIRLEFLMNELKMFHQYSFTTALAYVLLTGFFVQWCSITPALVANSFLIWIFIQLSKLYNNPSPKTLLFNTGLIVGLTVLCYHPTAILILVVLFALAVVRPFRLSEWLVLLLGICALYYIIIALLFLYDRMYLVPGFVPDLKINMPFAKPDIWFWINLSTIALLLLSGFIAWSPQHNRMVIQVRKNWSVTIVMLIIILAVPFIFQNAGLQSAILSIVPLSAFIANVFLYPRRLWLPNLLFWIAVAAVIHNNWLLIKN